MKPLFPLFVFLFLTIGIRANGSENAIDSINKKLISSSGPEKIELLIQLYDIESNQNPDTALYFIKQANALAQELKNDTSIIKTLVCLGEYYDHHAQFNAFAKEMTKAYQKSLEIKDSALIASTGSSLSYAYYKLGEFNKALTFALESMKLNEKLNNKEEFYNSLNTCGNIYNSIKNFTKALECFNKNLPIANELKDDKKTATVLNNIGLAYQGMTQYTKALEYFEKGLIYSKRVNDNWVAASYLNIGIAYGNLNQNEKAIEYFNKTLSIAKQMQFDFGLIYANNYLGECYIKIKDYNKAIDYLKDALAVGEKVDAKPELSDTYRNLARAYRNLEDYKKADEYFQLHTQLKDSMLNESSAKQITEMQAKYDSEKQEQAILLLNKDAEIKKVELGKSNTIRNYSLGLAALILMLVFVLFRSNKNKQKANEVLTMQKAEILSQRNFIESQKNTLEYQKEEITDSIKYAKRIQQAILPPLNELDKHVPESFVVYTPKDIVAGDFFWIEKIDQLIFFAAADCTGHGVPGAMVSVVCNNALNRALREFGLRVPGEILDKTREIVIQQFEKSEEEVKDGMDISFCALNTKTNTLSWAGANNPLWIIRENEFIEIKPDKMPIGKYGELNPYTTHTISVKKADTIYVFTDGYADQFGGPNGKKYKSSTLKELLKSLQVNNMREQKDIILNTFNLWKGELEQVDDICVIGLRI